MEVVSLTLNGVSYTPVWTAITSWSLTLPAAAGTLHFAGQDLGPLPRHARAALGIGYMPEDRGLVPQLTVEENILLPLWVQPALPREQRLALAYELLPEAKAMPFGPAATELIHLRGMEPMSFISPDALIATTLPSSPPVTSRRRSGVSVAQSRP